MSGHITAKTSNIIAVTAVMTAEIATEETTKHVVCLHTHPDRRISTKLNALHVAVQDLQSGKAVDMPNDRGHPFDHDHRDAGRTAMLDMIASVIAQKIVINAVDQVDRQHSAQPMLIGVKSVTTIPITIATDRETNLTTPIISQRAASRAVDNPV